MRMVPSARSKIQEKLMTRFRFQDLEIWKEAVGIGNILFDIAAPGSMFLAPY
jgi:hypothetical protein